MTNIAEELAKRYPFHFQHPYEYSAYERNKLFPWNERPSKEEARQINYVARGLSIPEKKHRQEITEERRNEIAFKKSHTKKVLKNFIGCWYTDDIFNKKHKTYKYLQVFLEANSRYAIIYPKTEKTIKTFNSAVNYVKSKFPVVELVSDNDNTYKLTDHNSEINHVVRNMSKDGHHRALAIIDTFAKHLRQKCLRYVMQEEYVKNVKQGKENPHAITVERKRVRTIDPDEAKKFADDWNKYNVEGFSVSRKFVMSNPLIEEAIIAHRLYHNRRVDEARQKDIRPGTMVEAINNMRHVTFDQGRPTRLKGKILNVKGNYADIQLQDQMITMPAKGRGKKPVSTNVVKIPLGDLLKIFHAAPSNNSTEQSNNTPINVYINRAIPPERETVPQRQENVDARDKAVANAIIAEKDRREFDYGFIPDIREDTTELRDKEVAKIRQKRRAEPIVLANRRRPVYTRHFTRPLDIKHQNMLDAIRLRDPKFAEFEAEIIDMTGEKLLNTIEARYKQVTHRKKK